MKLADIRLDGGTQPRSEISEETVAEYASAITDGAVFPPIVVFHDGVDNWLADGFHRVHAYRHAGIDDIQAEIKPGTKRDAILYSVGANTTHGQRRTNDDKRRAVMVLLNDAEWATWSDSEIGRRCAVDHKVVSRLRPSLGLSPSEKAEPRTYTNKHGQEATMNIAKIGGKDTGKLKANGRRLVLPAGRETKEVRAAQIRKLASVGNNAAQIGEALGVGAFHVKDIAIEHNIALPDHVIGRPHLLDMRRIIAQTVDDLDASAASLETLPISFSGISRSDAAEWAAMLTESLRKFSNLRNKLREYSNGKD